MNQINEKKAFVLIEVIVYLSLSTVVILMLSGLLSSTMRQATTVLQEQRQAVQLLALMQHLRTDVMQSFRIHAWNEKELHMACRWLDADDRPLRDDVCWTIRSDGSVRRRGSRASPTSFACPDSLRITQLRSLPDRRICITLCTNDRSFTLTSLEQHLL